MTGTFDAQKIAPIDEKIAPIGNMSLPTDADKYVLSDSDKYLLTDAQKIAPIDQKFAPAGTVDALATESPIEPGAGALPPPPGSSVA
jgi:hypothetical protein